MYILSTGAWIVLYQTINADTSHEPLYFVIECHCLPVTEVPHLQMNYLVVVVVNIYFMISLPLGDPCELSK